MTFIGSLSGSPSSGSSSTSWSQLNTGSISGLASGINTDSVVQGLMQAAQIPLVSALQQRQILQWKQESYQQVNTALTTLQNTLSTLKLQSTFMTQTASSSNSSLVTATPNALSAAGTYSVTVTQLAQGATVSSANILSVDPKYGNTTLANLTGNPLGAHSTDPSIGVYVNGQQFTFNPKTDTINTVLSAISGNPSSGVTAFYDPNAGKVVMQTTATGSSAQIQVTSDTGGLFQNVLQIGSTSSVTSGAFASGQLGATSASSIVEINGSNFQFSNNEPLANVVTDINAKTSSTGVTASVNGSKQLVLSGGSTLYTPISISDPNSVLQMASSPQNAAHDAQYTVNGLSSSSSTNSANYNGVTLNLQGVTGGSPVTVTVSANTSAVVQTIQNFVQQYNTTLQTMQGLYNQTRNYSYLPLTTAQASQMSQTQIDEWNQKAQAGMLQSDSLLSSTMSSVEHTATTMVNGLNPTTVNGQPVTLNTLSSIGITPISPLNGISVGNTAPGVTTSGWNTYGLLQMNTTQLTAAVQANPQAVMNLFTSNPALTGGTTDPTYQGLAVQLYSSVSSSVSQITQEAGKSVTPLPTTPNSNTGTVLLPSTAIDPNANFTTLFGVDGFDTSFLGGQVKAIDTRVSQMQSQLSQQQQQYQKQFTQMEKAIQQINSQSASFIAMLGSSGTTGH